MLVCLPGFHALLKASGTGTTKNRYWTRWMFCLTQDMPYVLTWYRRIKMTNHTEGGLQCLGVHGNWKPCLPWYRLIDCNNERDTENKEDSCHLILYENHEVPRQRFRWTCIIRAQWHKRDDSSPEYCSSIFFHTKQFLFKFSSKGNFISGSNYLLPKEIKALNFLPLQADFGRKE